MRKQKKVPMEKTAKALAKVGIIALVDEATGHQYDRERYELQKIFRMYIGKELLHWQKEFPDAYHKELFRLNGWDFTVKGIKRERGAIGKWTNTLIYEGLSKEVLGELRKSSPKGKRRYQNLTNDTGHPDLSALLNQVLAIFGISDSMEEAWGNFRKLNDRRKMKSLESPFEFDNRGYTVFEEVEEPLTEFNKNLKRALIVFEEEE